MEVVVYWDSILVPVSVFVIVGYHAYLSHSINNKPSSTTFGTNKLKRSAWRLNLHQGDDKKAMLVIQSLRNTLMATLFTATITILVNLALAALNNNTYKASHNNDLHHMILSSKLFGSKSDILSALKYASASLFLVISFMFSSMAIGFLIDANFLMNAHHHQYFLCEQEGYTQTILERGFTLALIANRLLCSSLPLLLWMLGPFPVFISSLALVCCLHQLDFVPQFSK